MEGHLSILRQSALVERRWVQARANEDKVPLWTNPQALDDRSEYGRKRTFELPFQDGHEGKFSLVYRRWLFLATPQDGRVYCCDLNGSGDEFGKFVQVYKSQEAEIIHVACVENMNLAGGDIAFAVLKERRRDIPPGEFPNIMFVLRVFHLTRRNSWTSFPNSKILKIEAPSFHSAKEIKSVQVKEVLVSPAGWHSLTFTAALSPSLLVVADDSRLAGDVGVLCMDTVSFEMYQLSLDNKVVRYSCFHAPAYVENFHAYYYSQVLVTLPR